LLLVIGYQNLVTYPALRAAADQPWLLPSTALHGGMRGGVASAITADRRHGIALAIDLPPQPNPGAYVSYSIDLYDPQGKLARTGLTASPVADGQRLSLAIPGGMLRDGSYTLAVSGVTPHGERTAIDKYIFDIHLND
jgi:hypothetical protein